MILKDGTKFSDLDSAIVFAAIVANDLWQELGVTSGATLTSGTDGVHSTGSLHYEGRAIDIRIWNLPNGGDDAQGAARMLRERLTDDYDVVVESTHIHVEFDPR